MDFYFVKVFLQSRTTGEKGIGYFFGKKNEPVEVRFILYPRKYKFEEDFDLENDDYFTFVKKFDSTYAKIVSTLPDVIAMTRDFNHYIHLQISKEGRTFFSAKLHTLIVEREFEVLRVTFHDLFKEWEKGIDVNLFATLLSYESLSRLASEHTTLEETIKSVLDRPDVKDLPEIYPLIDPTKGKSIDEIEVGSGLYFVILDPKNHLEELKSEFPKHFDEEGNNTIPFKGVLISKEFISLRDPSFMLIKIGIGENHVGKAVISRSLRLLTSEERLIIPSSRVEKEQTVLTGVPQEKQVKMGQEGMSLGDWIAAISVSLLVVAVALIIAYFFF
ncbi:MAG: hypothetical protein PWP37_275 [Thermotogota bacterium]|nr:hypothetical protein [Thermotogota bacterium]